MQGQSTILGLVVAAALAVPAHAGDLVVIVHAEREVELTASEVAQIYLRKRRFWDDGKPIVPVNRESGSEARNSFVRAIFGNAARQLEVYWNRQYFRGILPPATLASDEATKLFVASERLSIGYVSPDLVDDSVNAVLRIYDD
jgi:ABC-type phosphate transport system substrate-binding protein